MKLIDPRALPLFVILILIRGALPTHAQDSDQSYTLFEELEKKVEIDRHQHLEEVKRASDVKLTDFTTDGCSGGLSAGWRYLVQNVERLREHHGDTPPWESCCVSHDRDYHLAGGRSITAEKSFYARLKADESLRRCVLDTGRLRAPELVQQYGLSAEEAVDIYRFIGDLMYRAVRIGGVPCSGLPWRWGYGWPDC